MMRKNKKFSQEGLTNAQKYGMIGLYQIGMIIN